MSIMSLHKQLKYKCLFVYRTLNNKVPEYISNMYICPPSRYSNSRNYQLSLPRSKIDIFKTGVAFSGAFPWNSLTLSTRSCHSFSSFKQKLPVHLESCIGCIVTENC